MRPLTARFRLVPSRRSSREIVGPTGAQSAPRPRRGFSIVEAIVAIMMLAIGVLAMISSSTVVIRQLSSSSQRTAAASVAGQRMERLRSINLCADITDGRDTTWSMAEEWQVVEVEQNAGAPAMTVDLSVIYPKGRTIDTLVVTTNIPCSAT